MEEINIGAKVQEYRMMKQYTLRELAARAEMTPSMLSQIEKNTVNPSINTLKSIASALGVPMFKFFQSERVSENLIVRRGDNIHLGSVKDGVIYKLLTPDLNGTIEFCLMEIPPHSRTAELEKSHVGEEVAFVVEGSVNIQLNQKEFSLNEGDSIQIPAGVNHLWYNEGDAQVRVIFAMTPPGFLNGIAHNRIMKKG